MKFFIIAIAGVISAVSAQTPPNLPQCGTNVMIQAVSSSGCAFTDAACICKNQAILNAAKNGLPKACTGATDQKAFADFFNGQCNGQPGFPIKIGNSASGGSDSGSSGTATGNSNNVNGARVSGAVASGAPKPSATAAGAAKPVSNGQITQVSVVVLGAAAGIALFGLS
ncbi:hypothetical protein EJ08DRAFT_649654 [Tothia fuscella]|uniref:CFEM domain-containing protein n=1 Tax=Tothia fuscella TaxID=1048955 RepID=A0A9P4NQS4_9PEZI|nr:hypothetical protein EJ08DRAFT_649654 [Tothia fuscella]